MKKNIGISISNLGRVTNASIDLKPLTIFIGPNNTGKTWSAYAIYAIFHEDFIRKTVEKTLNKSILKNLLDKCAKDLVKHNKAKINFSAIHEHLDINKNFGKDFKKYFSKFMKCDPKYFDKLKISLDYDTATVRNKFLEADISIGADILLIKKEKKIGDSPSINLNKEKRSDELILSVSNPGSIDKDIDKEDYFKRNVPSFIKLILEFGLKSFFYERLFVFPPERTALTYMSDDLVYKKIERLSEFEGKISDREIYEKLDYEKLFYSKPILDYIKLIRQIKNISLSENIHKRRTGSKFAKLASILEKDVLSGKVSITKDELNSRFIYEFGNKKLDLTTTSSMVKDLAIFSLYLRYVAEKGDLVIIDEPEMSLHPEAQAKLIELVCISVNRGIKFIITTHTPYIVDHLTNLISAHNSNNKDEIEKEFFLKNRESFLPPDSLGVYLFGEDGEVSDVFDRKENTINWGTFGKVTQKIANLYFKL